MVKKGDTLIEVLLAVGIFSMIAISVVAVMSGGTSEAQLALETTLTRQEIDAQAEALRYIHDSYINDKNTTNENLPTVALWKRITENAITLEGVEGSEKDKAIVEYAPTECVNVANSENADLREHAFILNTRQLRLNNAVAYVPAQPKDSDSIFKLADTYPRLRFLEDGENLITEGTTTMNSNNLVGDLPAQTRLRQVDGLYVIAVADSNTTQVLDIDGQKIEVEKYGPAFYDFYIRSCWYGTDAETASTISTVIRLHNPDVQTKYYSYTSRVCYEDNNCSEQGFDYDRVLDDRNLSISQPGWTFMGWCASDTPLQLGDSCPPENRYDPGTFYNNDPNKKNYKFYPIWSQSKYIITYDSNGSTWSRPDQVCTVDWGNETNDCYIAADDITRSGYAFEGWCDGEVDSKTGSCSGTTYSKGQNIKAPFPDNTNIIHLKAIWRERNETITIKATWNAGRNSGGSSYPDFDSYIAGKKSDGTPFTASYSNLKPTETVSGVTRTLAQLDHDCISTCGDETFTINTLGGRDYYYYILNRSGWFRINNNLTVTVSGPYLGTMTFKSSAASGSDGGIDSYRYWNVFSYKDGKIVVNNTITSSPNISY